MSDDRSRVSMVWPDNLKEKVRERVGSRGLTEFVVAAVETHLGIRDIGEGSRELNEAKDLAQRLADSLALGGDYEDRASALRLLELPSWIQTIGWPEHLAVVVNPEDSTAELVESEPQDVGVASDEPDLPAIGDPDTIRSAPPATPAGDLLERIRSKAAEKGVDLSGVDLKSASSIQASAENDHDHHADDEDGDAAKDSNACPECGTELVNGECWECFS